MSDTLDAGEYTLKTLIVDDHPLVLKGLRVVVEKSIDNAEIFEAKNAENALKIAGDQRPDLVLLDLQMPSIGGFEMLGQLSNILPKTSVAVVISSSVAKEDMKRAFALGAMGYIPKSSASDVMEKALQLVLSGGIYVPPEMLDMVGEPQEKENLEAPQNLLTPRQIEVLELLSAGKVNKEIARHLECAESTVKTHIAAIFRELKARNRTEAVVQAQALGYLSTEN